MLHPVELSQEAANFLGEPVQHTALGDHVEELRQSVLRIRYRARIGAHERLACAFVHPAQLVDELTDDIPPQ